jgi:hypothetical protein
MLEILNTAITVTAEAHNPSILHPSFLTSQKIVPETWELADPPICTPLLAVVKYAQSIVISVEPQKLQVMDNAPSDDPARSELVGIVSRYTATLPFVRYTGLGINITGFVATEAADDTLRSFLAPGSWNEGELRVETVGVRFVYRVLGTQLRLSMDGATIQSKARANRAGIVLSANYHSDLGKSSSATDVATTSQKFGDCFRHFRGAVSAILHLQTEHAAN